MVLYPIAIEAGDENRAARIVVPDLPDCAFAADYQDDILTLAREAIGQWIAKTAAAGHAIPAPSAIDEVAARPEFAGRMVTGVEIDLGQDVSFSTNIQ